MSTYTQGFTALELLVTMAIVAILLSAGVPAFRSYSWNLRMSTAMDGLQTDLSLARRSAIKLNTRTVICPAVEADTCQRESGGASEGESEWQNGWIVFADLNADRQRQKGEPLLKQSVGSELISISSSRSRSQVRFYPNGSAPGSNMSIRFCDDRGAQFAGKISVSSSGRIKQQTGGIKSTENCP